jgi:hypothetical protein
MTGPCPARPLSRGGQARHLLLVTTLERLLRPPATTVRGTLDQAAHLLAMMPGRGGAHWPLTGTAPDGSRRAGLALSGRTEGISRLARYVSAGAVSSGRDVPLPVWAPRRRAAQLWTVRTTGRWALTVVMPCTITGTICSKEVNDT